MLIIFAALIVSSAAAGWFARGAFGYDAQRARRLSRRAKDAEVLVADIARDCTDHMDTELFARVVLDRIQEHNRKELA